MNDDLEEDIGEERYNYLLGQLCLCACGTPDLALEWVHKFLKATKENNISDWSHKENEQWVPSDGAITMLVLNLLDHAGVIEHGGGISASWLTAKGERLLAIFEGAPLTQAEKNNPLEGCCEVANWTQADQQDETKFLTTDERRFVCFLCRQLCTLDEIAGSTPGKSSILWFCYRCFHPDYGHDVTAKETTR